ncbi:MAG: ABC transporter ATP-binding protein [Phycisphaerae bacterium]|nr:ABC transporter ATP-binding protein [Phycisphaerae bacterium]
MKVDVAHLKRYFGRTRAVDDISFSFASGQTFGFVGPNGAGKTTAMRILATLDEPTDGDATIDGVSVVEEPERARRLVGFVPDTLATHHDMTVHDYLDFFARAYGIRNPHRDRVVHSVEEFTNLLGIREKFLNALSKGMKQRVSLARALVHDPPVLIMDEPAAGLDPRARVELRELLKVLSRQGKAILISSHILTELAEICDGAVIIEQGRILRAGSLNELLHESAALRTVIIRPNGRGDELHKELLEMPDIQAVRPVGHELEVDLAGSDETCSDLLTQIVSRGYRIYEFRQRRVGLEQIFMTITKGEVQ